MPNHDSFFFFFGSWVIGKQSTFYKIGTWFIITEDCKYSGDFFLYRPVISRHFFELTFKYCQGQEERTGEKNLPVPGVWIRSRDICHSNTKIYEQGGLSQNRLGDFSFYIKLFLYCAEPGVLCQWVNKT